MKKLLLLLITLTTFANVSFASFPITENNTVLTANFEDPGDEEETEDPAWWVIIYVLNAIILISGTYLLLRTFWRAWNKRKWWARKLVPLVLLCLLPTLLVPYVGHLISIGLLIILGIIMLIRKLMGKTIVW
jgi:drug/metabolite transporter superfamily protein YnfA